jgi:aspartyl/asparaginyl beta-hydroxylase (cupin superfamily)
MNDSSFLTHMLASRSFFTDWFKMGQFIPENEARAPKTAALLHQIPDVYNAFFSVLEPHQHIDPHWGHYKGYVALSYLLNVDL